ncbi:ROK family protein [Clostridium sp. BNL1100]|uniref:ROK family protein n=1 Tax=Clostridium sp. BNL1100 TaxID=755731 RepID=UPI00024A72E1|nr:ROK family protein [Clostridium sp. BNL1100]AEY67226.1 transcriptional regulator/sugar kinase [Clostridium sp. BNL1100]
MSKLAIGIDIGGTNIKAALIDSTGSVSDFCKIPTNAKEGFKKTFISIQNLIQRYIDSIGKDNIVGIGCACTGQVDSVSGKVLYAASTIPELSEFELKKNLVAFTNLPVEVENDVNACALGEKWLGAARDVEDFLCITLGTGIGGAIYKNGGIEHGYRGVAAEFGHMSIDMNGEQCNCGNKGCFERYGSVTALIKHFKEELLNGNKSIVTDMVNGHTENISGEIIYAAKSSGDPLATKIVKEYNEAIICGTVSLVHIFNPEAVIFGGGITTLGDIFIEPIKKELLSRLMPVFREDLIIRRAELGDNAAICGIVRELF